MMAELERAYQDYGGELRAYLYARTGDADLVDDLLGAVFCEACGRIGDWQHRVDAAARGDPLRSWLYRLAASRAVDHHRRTRRRRGITLDTPTEAPDPEEQIDGWDAAAIIRPVLPLLPPRQHLVLRLRFWDGCSLEEAAAALGTSVGAVKALQHRAIETLRQAIEQ